MYLDIIEDINDLDEVAIKCNKKEMSFSSVMYQVKFLKSQYAEELKDTIQVYNEIIFKDFSFKNDLNAMINGPYALKTWLVRYLCIDSLTIDLSELIKIDMSNASDFKLLDRKVVDILNKIPEKKGFFRAISFWVGYKKATVEFEVKERTEGTTKWSLISLIKYAISNISAYTTAPMQIVTVLGFIMLGITSIFGVWAFVDKIQGRALEGMTTVILILIFIGSIMMISLGIIGYYVARIYEEIKGRPKYIISASCKGKKNN